MCRPTDQKAMPFATLCLTPVAVRLAPLWPCLQGKTVKAVTLLSLKRTHDLFVGNHGQKVPLDEEAQKVKIACKVCTTVWCISCSKLAGACPKLPSLVARAAGWNCRPCQHASVDAFWHTRDVLRCDNPDFLHHCRCGTSMARCKDSSHRRWLGHHVEPLLRRRCRQQQTASRTRPS